MQFYTYKAVIRKSNGSITTKYIDATSAAIAQMDASRYGRVVRVSLVAPTWFDNLMYTLMKFLPIWLTKWIPIHPDPGFSKQHRIEFLQTLSNILVGYPINESLSIMIQNFRGPIQVTCRRLRHSIILTSKDPVDALKELGDRYLPGVTLAIIATNAKVDKLSNAFKEGLNFEREMATLESGQIAKMLEAILWFVGATVMMIAADVYGWSFMESINYFSIMPEEGSSRDMLEATRITLSVFGKIAIATLTIWFLFILVIGAGRDINPSVVERWILHIPIVRAAMLNRRNFLTCYQVNKLLVKGVSLVETLTHVRNELESGVLKDDIARVILLINNGSPDWVDGFHSFSDLDRALLKSSNNQNEIAEIFSAQSDQFLKAYKKSINLLSIFHWVFISVFMIVLIGILSMLMFLPMAGGFDMVNQL